MQTKCINCILKHSFWTKDNAPTEVIRLRRTFSLRASSYMICRKKKREAVKVIGKREREKANPKMCVCVSSYDLTHENK